MTVYTVFPTNKHDLPSPPKHIPLHGLDKISVPIQIRNHRFYHAPSDSRFDEIVDNLKDALAEALEYYLPMCGKLVTTEQGQIYVSLDEIRGTPLEVQINNEAFVQDNEELNVRPDPVLPPSATLLAVKITKFSCGTIVVASSFNHQVADLRGFLDFLELWSAIARHETIDLATAVPLDWMHTPGRFFDPSTDNTTNPPPFKLLDKPKTGPDACFTSPSTITYWKFSSEQLQKLKEDFSAPLTNGWISTGDALVALVCGAITRARKSANIPRLQGRSETNQESIVNAADGRERIPKSKKSKYFGNFNPLFNAFVDRADLESEQLDGSARVALAIRQTLTKQLSPESLAQKIAFFENEDNLVPPGRIGWGADIILTNWSRNDLQSTSYDMGWGKPFLATNGSGGAYPPAYGLITKNYDTDDMLIMLTVEQEANNDLVSDKLLNQYATLQN